ncbi:Gypsy retrotransposon integrase-like protein 1 [Paramarasmius palmivorus]|uniref:Gypsy retrotransposon integrase-like protein 1 n=1 Tax=Paramarasmius palmivorus TaxID=297713 RepID=A0AAW0EGM9_9AGAR
MTKKKRGPPKGTPRATKTVQSIIASILSTSKPYLPQHPDDVRQTLLDLAHHAQSLQEQLDRIRHPASNSSSPFSSPELPDYPLPGTSVPPPVGSYAYMDQVDLVTYQIESFDIDGPSRHFGESSGMELNASIIALKSEECSTRRPRKRPQFWNIHSWQSEKEDPYPDVVFPEDDLMNELIDRYFKNSNDFFPVLHRSTFQKCVADNLHRRDRYFAFTVLAVCAIGSRYSDDPRVFDDIREEPSAGWKYFRQIQLLRSTFLKPPPIYELQMYCLAILFLMYTSTPDACWTLLGHAVRCAQDIGLHKSPAEAQTPCVDSQLWNRVFWALVSIDVLMAAVMGRPRAMQSDDFDVPLPIECDDEYWDTADPKMAFKQPAGKPCKASFWVTFLKLMDILGFAQRTLYAVRKSEMWTNLSMSGPEWNEKVVSQLDSSLNAWIDAIPDHLLNLAAVKWDPDRIDTHFFNQSAVLYTAYYWVQMLVHIPFISPTDEEPVLTFPSLSICANAARSCLRIMEIQNRRSPMYQPTTLNAVYFCAVVLVLNVWRGKRMKTISNVSKELSDCYKCFEILAPHENRNQLAGRIRDLIADMISVTEPPNHYALKRRTSPLDEDEEEFDFVTSGTFPQSSSSPTSRPIAGSRRVSAHLGSLSPVSLQSPNNAVLSLPMSSAELGKLPIHSIFEMPGQQQQQIPDMNGTWSPDFVDWLEWNPSVDQSSDYVNRLTAESFSSMFGHIGMWSSRRKLS